MPDAGALATPSLHRRDGVLRIDRLRLWHVPLTSHVTYNMAGGKTCATTETVLVALDAGGRTGWGEVCPIPHYLPAYARGVAPALAELAPVILGGDPTGAEALMAAADRHLIDHRYAKSALDVALWDLTGQIAGLPLHALMGGRRQDRLPLYHSVTCVEPDEMARIAAGAHGKGMRQFQVKLGASGDWTTDVERIAKVREAVGPGPLVYADWNCGATTLEATRVARAVAHLDVMLEQPCATIPECAQVRHATGLPMKLDEIADDVPSLLEGRSAGCLDAVTIKLSKFGGLSASRRARDLCEHLGARMCVECTWGSDVITAAVLHLGAATRPDRLLNVCDLSHYVAPRVAPEAPVRQGGTIAPPEGPGLGVAPDPASLGDPDLILE
ncbi:MAG: mandelate racemase/muconate lactonizing enzyme family protein [Paracoccaceae bacterium]